MMLAPNLEVKWDQVSRAEENEREALVRKAQAELAPSGLTECTDCGADIPPARLKAAPFATRCIGCQTKFERTRP